MTVYRLPGRIEAFLFDIDGTLYSNDAYGRFQSEVVIRELAKERGESYGTTLAAIDRVRAEYAAANGGAATSLGNAMAALGVDMATSVAWRSRLIDPSEYLAPDSRLRAALGSLAAKAAATAGGSGGRSAALVAVTNNPRSVGLATLKALGVEDLFLRVVGLDDTMLSKPAREPYLLAARIAGAEPAACVSVGDRYDVDLSVPLELGMGAVLVAGAEDVYALSGVLFPVI